MNTDSRHEPDDERSEAVRQADAGARAWRAVVHAQQTATPDHADFYGLAAELHDCVLSLQSLMGVLERQVDGYAAGLPSGSWIYDDTRTADPHERLLAASVELDAAAEALRTTEWSINRFWSAIGHIGVEDVTS